MMKKILFIIVMSIIMLSTLHAQYNYQSNPFNNYTQTKYNPFDHYTQLKQQSSARESQRGISSSYVPNKNLKTVSQIIEESKQLRRGYCGYDTRWLDSNFYYRHYGFIPGDNVVFSPWYCYPHLPGYIIVSKTITPNGQVISQINNSNYWHVPLFLDDFSIIIVNNFSSSFIKNTPGGILVYFKENIRVFSNYSYFYSLDYSNCYGMIYDNIKITKTLSYSLVDIRESTNKDYRFIFRHDYIDPFSIRRATYHVIVVSNVNTQYLITDFGIIGY